MMLPEHADIKTWASSLRVDFPYDDIPVLNDENEWKTWGNVLSQCTTFIENNSPGTLIYSDWKEWAQRVFFCMNNN